MICRFLIGEEKNRGKGVFKIKNGIEYLNIVPTDYEILTLISWIGGKFNEIWQENMVNCRFRFVNYYSNNIWNAF
jgi:hypothetical protein